MAVTLTHQTSVLLTGVFSTLKSQWLYNAGAAAFKSLLTVSCTYVGMALAHFVPRRAAEEVERSPTQLTPRPNQKTLLDITANALLTIGVFLIGSGLYQVVYSSIVAFTALLSTVQVRWPEGMSGKTGWSRGVSVKWNPRAVNVWQWVAIAIVTGGLVLPALDAMSLSHRDSHSAKDTSSRHGSG
ncbi:hypothetical protein M427DRAFT_31447 [Gonapodya prolifera JEL478]|uniref:Uncharacterized protein n=1 Tax=Gonapodya prolifera (strain JEL478) TaxID=1344416 RepID=A0A139AHM1_GONPJ|nr:hypothetical protein M427DRAFT_31447 [Gonapodya prolifera JEL478]|eukprot:KXS16297.1 hypothetical protein M427DRAFT_31447 [Gonapodya prolifera JEL478]